MPDQYRVCIVGCGRMGGTIDEEVKEGKHGSLPYSHAAGYTSCLLYTSDAADE